MQDHRTKIKTCAHCGRDFIIGGAMWRNGREYPLCHPSIVGTSPDCYHLVTTRQEEMGSQLG